MFTLNFICHKEAEKGSPNMSIVMSRIGKDKDGGQDEWKKRRTKHFDVLNNHF
jgi:hypothetical protein